MGAKRVFATVAVMGALALGLTACSPPINDSEVAEAFGELAGVVSTDARCSQPLPFTFSCTTSVVVARDVSEEQLVALMEKARQVGLRSPLDIYARSLGESSNDIRIENAAKLGEDLGVARMFLTGLATEGVESLTIGLAISRDGTNDPQRNVFVNARLPLADDAALLELAGKFASILPSGHLAFGSERLTYSSVGRLLADEVTLYMAVSREFSVIRGAIEPDYVEIQLDPSADLAAAKEFAAERPEFGRISTVALSDDDSVDVRDVDSASSSSVLAVTEAARQLPQFRSATVRNSTVDFTVDSPADARRMDAALGALAEYNEVSIRFSLPQFSTSRTAGGQFYFDVWEALASNPVITSASVGQYSNEFGELHVKVDGKENTAPYDVGFALAASGLAELPSTSIIIGVRGTDGLYSTTFTSGKTISPKTDKWLSTKQAAALKQGWIDGQR